MNSVVRYYQKPATYRRQDYCTFNVRPILGSSEGTEPSRSKKRKRSSSNSPSSICNPVGGVNTCEPQTLSSYLLNKFPKGEVYGDSARLFGTILLIFEYLAETNGTYMKSGWPVPPTYKGEVVQLRICKHPDELKNEQPEIERWNEHHASLLKNSKEFYLLIQNVDGKRFLFHKVVKQLVPSFLENDTKSDEAKIQNLTAWISFIILKLCDIAKTENSSLTSSTSSSGSQTENQSESEEIDSRESLEEEIGPGDLEYA